MGGGWFLTSEKCLLENTLGNITLVRPHTHMHTYPPSNFTDVESDVQRGEESGLKLYMANGRARPGTHTFLSS